MNRKKKKLEECFCKETINDETLTKANAILVIRCANLEQKIKKQKEEIDDYKEDISNLLNIINKNCNELKCTSDEWLIIQKYQNKEALE